MEDRRPTAPLADEIDDHLLDETSAGTAGPTFDPICSYYLGNTGYFCTLTKECQKNCA